MPPEVIMLSQGDVVQVTDNNLLCFGDLLIVEAVKDDGLDCYQMRAGEKFIIHIYWGQFEYIGKARLVFRG